MTPAEGERARLATNRASEEAGEPGAVRRRYGTASYTNCVTSPGETKQKITIIGTGLIGGSIGLGLKAAGLPMIEVVGHDRDRDAESRAERMGAIDKREHNLPRAVEGAGLVIIATPVLAVREVMEQMAPDLAKGAVVTDTASTKAQVMRWAAELLPEHASFVGGHPMAGKETPGIDSAEAALLRGKAYCLCPAVNAHESAVKSVLGLIQVIGAEPLFIDPGEHDVYAAAVSHLPLMLSTALFQMLRGSPAWPDMGIMASSGFRDVTRLASSDPQMSHDIWATNREAIIHWLDRLASELQHFRDLLQDAKDEQLLEIFGRAQIERDTFVREPPKRQLEAVLQAPDAGRTVMDMLMGGMMAERMRKIQKMPELMRQAPPEPAEGEEDSGETKRKPSLADRIAEDVRRDLEKLEKKRAPAGQPTVEDGE